MACSLHTLLQVSVLQFWSGLVRDDGLSVAFHRHAAGEKLVIGTVRQQQLPGAHQANHPGCGEEGLHIRYEIQRALMPKDEDMSSMLPLFGIKIWARVRENEVGETVQRGHQPSKWDLHVVQSSKAKS